MLNKAAIYGLLFDVAAEVRQIIAANPEHLRARIDATMVLHTWGSALTHQPDVHGIVPGGGLSPDGKTLVACGPGFFLSVRVLWRLSKRRLLEELQRQHQREVELLRRATRPGRSQVIQGQTKSAIRAFVALGLANIFMAGRFLNRCARLHGARHRPKR